MKFATMAWIAGALSSQAVVPTPEYRYRFDNDAQSSGTKAATLFFYSTATPTVSFSGYAPRQGVASILGNPANASTTTVDGAYAGANAVTAFPDQRRTIAMWFRANPVQPSSNPTLFSQGFTSASGQRFDILLVNGNLRFEIGGGNAVTSGLTLTDNCWHHFALVVSEAAATLGDVQVYIDGMSVPLTLSSPTTAISTTNFRFIVGDSFTVNRDFLGYMDEVQIWESALTASQVAEVKGTDLIYAYDAAIKAGVPGDSFPFFIQFDPTATSASLAYGTTTVDLKALDPSGTGKVPFAAMPTTTTDYTLTVGKGISSEQRTVQIFIFETVPPNTYTNAVIADQPLAYYRFEEAAGAPAAQDASGNGKDTVSLVGSPVFGNTGAVGAAVTLNGADALLTGLTYNPSTSGSGPGGGYTVEALVRLDSASASTAQAFVSQQGGSGRTQLNVSPSGEYQSFVGNSAKLSGTILPSKSWCHLTMVYDSASLTLRFYLDGTSLATIPTTAVESATGNWVLGCQKLLNQQFVTGSLDEIAIYGKMLDDPNNDGELGDSRIGAHYSAYLAVAAPLLGLDASETTLDPGGSAVLRWKTGDLADTVAINGVSNPGGAAAGGVFSTTVMPQVTTTYTITVTRGGQSFTQSVTIVVNVPDQPATLEAIGFLGGSFQLLAKTPDTSAMYRVRRGITLADSFPTEVTTFTPTGEETVITDPAPPTGKAFYILEKLPVP